MVKGGRGGGSKKKAQSKSAKAGLTFPVARIGRALRAMRLAKRYGLRVLDATRISTFRLALKTKVADTPWPEVAALVLARCFPARHRVPSPTPLIQARADLSTSPP